MAVSIQKSNYNGVTWDTVDGVVIAKEDGVNVYGGYKGDPRRAWKVVNGNTTALQHNPVWYSSVGRVISPNGAYVGGYFMIEVPGSTYSVLWGGAAPIEINSLKNGYITAVNNSGTGVGHYQNSSNGSEKGAIKFDKNGNAVTLSIPQNAYYGQPESISPSGNVIGGGYSFFEGNNYKIEALLWINGVPKPLKQLLADAGATYPNIANGMVKKIEYSAATGYVFTLVGLEYVMPGVFGKYCQYKISGLKV